MTPTPNNRPTRPANTTPGDAAAKPAAPATPTNPRYLDQLARWNVILLHDEDHSYNYITTMLREVFRVTVPKAVELATQMTKTGRAVCMTTHREYAEFKRDQVAGFGKDYLVDGCPGSMTALVEQA
jgi:ATP-dependent Clp protease adaptor protein ClpS